MVKLLSMVLIILAAWPNIGVSDIDKWSPTAALTGYRAGRVSSHGMWDKDGYQAASKHGPLDAGKPNFIDGYFEDDWFGVGHNAKRH